MSSQSPADSTASPNDVGDPDPPTDPGAGRAGGVIIGWLLSRAVMVALAFTVEWIATGDVDYYWRKIAALFEVGLPLTLNEYPTPVVWLLTVPYGAGFGTDLGYLIAFIGLMLVLDAGFCRVLWVTAGRRRDAAVTFWLFFVFLLGPLCLLRFDLVPAVLVGAAILLSRRSPWFAGALIAIGASIKLWPALLIIPMLAYRRGRRGTVIGFLTTGIALAVISLVTGGLERLVSPLGWQSGRGLQIESVWATPLMLMRLFSANRWSVAMSEFQAFEVFGPGVDIWLSVSTAAMVLGMVLMVVLFVRAFLHPEPSTAAIGMVLLATIALLAVTNKTLSPQYLVWLAGPMAALLLVRQPRPDGRPTMFARLAVQLLVIAVLTHLIYPLTYVGLYGEGQGVLLYTSTALLVLRNVGLLIFTIATCAVAWRMTRRPAKLPGR